LTRSKPPLPTRRSSDPRKTKCRHPYVAPRVVSISFRIGGTQNQAANPSFRVPSYLHRKAHEYGKTTHAFHRALGQNQYSDAGLRSEEHTSELQSPDHLV